MFNNLNENSQGMKKPTEFTLKVLKIVKCIPKGKVATYSQIAKYAGKPHGTRGVVWILHSSSSQHELPWHRVINARGRISFPSMSLQERKQRALLVAEGIEFGEGDVISLKDYQWSLRTRARSLRQKR